MENKNTNNKKQNNKKNYNKIINYIAIFILIVFLVYGAYLTFKTKQNKIIINNIAFISDKNVYLSLKEFKDTNNLKVIAYIDSKHKVEQLGSAILYSQVLAYMHKDVIYYDIFDKNRCFKIYNTKSYLIDYKTCLNEIKNKDRYAIFLEYPKSNEFSTVNIIENQMHIYPNSYDTVFKTNKQVLEIIYPNLKDIQNDIQKYINKLNINK